MTYRNANALIRAVGLGALPDLLQERAGEAAVFKTFEAVDVPIALLDTPTLPMPLSAMKALFSEAARRLGDRTFGLQVGARMSHKAYGPWVDYSSAAPTLGEALRRVVATSWAHQRGGALALVPDGDHLVLCFIMPAMGVDAMQHADHMLSPAIKFLQFYLGRDWRPDWIEVNYPRDPDAALIEDWMQVPIRFGRDRVGVAFRAERLSCRHPVGAIEDGHDVTLRDVWDDVVLRDAPNPARFLSAVVSLRLLDGRSDIDGAARMAGLSMQTLQRRLREKGYNYREVLGAARRARAVRLLLETHLSVVEIALSLGYEDHANFTRAFRRWMGCAPTVFRLARGAGFGTGAVPIGRPYRDSGFGDKAAIL